MLKRKRYLALPLLGALLLSACTKSATPTSDAMVCVYDNSERGGQKLKLQLPPGSVPKSIGQDDQVIYLPTSNRFSMVHEDDAIRDPFMPKFYTAYDRNSVEVRIQGQVRFKINEAKGCEWYAKHGRRNANSEGDLLFNARGAETENSGWLHWLAENFGVTMQQIANSPTHKYTWNALAFDFPVNSNDVGDVPKGRTAGELSKIALGKDLGAAFTKQLNANLGGEYFCGIDAPLGSEPTSCPAMTFQVIKAEPTDKTLLSDGQRLQALKEQLRNAQNELKLLADKEKQLQAQLRVAMLQAQIDNAKCILLAKYGLDCDGHRAPLYPGQYPNSAPKGDGG